MKQVWQEALPLQSIQDISPVSGGDVNQAYKVDTTDETYFLLVQPNRSKDFFAAEMAGLEKFQEAGVVAPRVVSNGEIDGDAYLLITYLEEGGRGDEAELGQLMATLHNHYQPEGKFGFELPYAGADISFSNDWADTWAEVFIEQRMDHVRDALVDKGLWADADLEQYDKVRAIMVEALQVHESKSSLLHGDMWGGNHMFLTDGTPALFDPAPLYGDREFDLGITKAFGGFSQAFYDAYEAHYPLKKGATLRVEFYRLYILMVHLLKFGMMYDHSVQRSMERIVTSA